MQARSNPQPPGVENRGNFPRLLADLHRGPTCYIASGDIQETWVPCSRLREHVQASPGVGALHAHAHVSMAPKEEEEDLAAVRESIGDWLAGVPGVPLESALAAIRGRESSHV